MVGAPLSASDAAAFAAASSLFVILARIVNLEKYNATIKTMSIHE